jgi:starch synthase
MKVLFVSAEAHPFAKVGGLADVVGSLPQALRKWDVDARVVIPGYGFIKHEAFRISHLFSFNFDHREGASEVHVYSTVHEGTPVYLLQCWPYFGDDTSVYTDWQWDAPRFIHFNQMVMAFAFELSQRLDWFPDVFHVNDWHTGLLPFLIHENRSDPLWAKTGTVLGIHNLAYQGDNMGGWLWEAGIPGRHHPDLVYRDLGDNLMAMAITYSDILTTVSPRYAIEIQYPPMGEGLDDLIRTRVADLYGILNGINTGQWNPATDKLLVANYDASDFAKHRTANKLHLQREIGLEARADVPVIGIVSRLVWQKGMDLAIPALRRLLVDTDVQLVLLGTGDPDLESAFWRLGQDFSWRARCLLSYNAAVAQHIYAGSDLFLMPSHFEPCGIGQMMAMRYGSLPVVRETGGLADTVENYDNGAGERGTGFVFLWEEPDAVLGTLRWALDIYHNRSNAWQQMQRRAMQIDFGWDRSAQQYITLYRRAAGLSDQPEQPSTKKQKDTDK